MAKKTKTKNTVDDDSASRIMALFRGYSGASGTHGMPDLDPNGLKWAIKKTAMTINSGPTLEMWRQHLAGVRPLGVVPILDDATCVWGSIDIDKYNIDLLEVISRVEGMKLPLVPCRSKSGGLHLFLFCSEPVLASVMQLTLRNLAAMIGFADSEVFPKQTHINKEQGDSGSWMVMPYYGDTFGGKLQYQYGLKRTGAEQTLEEFINFAEKMRVTGAQVTELRRSSIQSEQPTKNGKAKREKRPFGDGPPCLQFMAEAGFPEGGRNNAMLHMGVYLKRAFPGNWKEVMSDYNHKFFKPPLPADEVSGVQKNLEKKDYEYTCDAAPMCNHCDSITCRTRKYGVGSSALPEILAMRKVLTEPAIYHVDVMSPSGAVTLLMYGAQLQYFSKFQGICMEYGHFMHVEISQKMWSVIVHDAFEKAELLPAPPDLAIGGRFRELMENFCTNRNQNSRKEDILRGVAWEDEERGRYWFTIEGLEKYLAKENVKMERSDIWARIRGLHGKDVDPNFSPKEFMNIKGRGKNVWWVPVSVLQKAPELDPPELPEEKL